MASHPVSKIDPVKSRAKRAFNLKNSLQILEKNGFLFEQKSPHHYLVYCEEKVADFWPSTGQWRVRPSNEYLRGVLALMTELIK